MQVKAADLVVGDKVLTLEGELGSFCREVWRLDPTMLGPDPSVTVHLKSRNGDDGLVCTVGVDAEITVIRALDPDTMVDGASFVQ